MSKDLLKDLAGYLPAQIVPGLVGFVSTPILTRLFLPDAYGAYSLVLAAVAVATTVLAWLPMAVIRFQPAYAQRGEERLFLGIVNRLTAFSVLAAGLLLAGALLAVQGRLAPVNRVLWWYGLVVVLLTVIFAVLQHVLRTRRRLGLYGLTTIWRSAGALLLGLVPVWWLGAGVESLLLGAALSLLVALLVLGPPVLGAAVAPGRRLAPAAREWLVYSLPLVAGNVAAWVLRLSDRYVIRGYRGDAEVGIYAASYNVADNTVALLVALFTLAAGPLVVRAWEQDGPAAAGALVTRVMRGLLLLGVPAAVGLTVLAGPLLELLTGAAYREGSRIVGWVAAGVLLQGVQQIFQFGFVLRRRTGPVMLTIGAAGVLNLGLNLLLVPRWGYPAAAVTTLLAYAVLLALTVPLARPLLPWRFPAAALARITVAAAAMGAGVVGLLAALPPWPAALRLVVGVAAGGLIYGLVLLMVREVRGAEWRAAWAWWRAGG